MNSGEGEGSAKMCPHPPHSGRSQIFPYSLSVIFTWSLFRSRNVEVFPSSRGEIRAPAYGAGRQERE